MAPVPTRTNNRPAMLVGRAEVLIGCVGDVVGIERCRPLSRIGPPGSQTDTVHPLSDIPRIAAYISSTSHAERAALVQSAVLRLT